jgi:DNA-binding transcriptional LysR family regulator
VPRKTPDLNLLPIAFALYDELSVSRAARLLGMSQPAVSMALRRMRETFDDPLFVRVASGIAPTPRAHAIVRQARPLVERLNESLLKGASLDPATSTRTITLAMTDVGEMAFLADIHDQLRARAPHCSIRSVYVTGAQLAHDLEKGEIDLAVGYFPTLALKNFRSRRVRIHQFACLMRAGHPLAKRLTPADFVAAEHLVVRADGRSQEVLERFLKRRRIRRKVAIVSPHFLAVPFMLQRTDLIATMPYAVASQFASLGRLAIVQPPYDIPGFELKLHWHRRFDNEPRSQWLRQQMMEVFRDDPAISLPAYARAAR